MEMKFELPCFRWVVIFICTIRCVFATAGVFSLSHLGKSPSIIVSSLTFRHFFKNHFKNIVPTKFYLYLEAGLPILISEEFEEACSLVREHKIGVIVAQSDLPNLDEILNTVDAEALRVNVVAFRENLFKKSVQELP